MKTRVFRNIIVAAAFIMSAIGMTAQNSLPAPGSGGSFNPAPIGGGGGGGMGCGPGWGGGPIGPGPGWGPGWCNPFNSPWWGNSPTYVNVTYSPNWENTGKLNLAACGYDAQGIWRVVPMKVEYYYNGNQYQVNVIDAWDPWTQMWNKHINVPAVNTSYTLRGTTYHFYVVLSYGTFYFNL